METTSAFTSCKLAFAEISLLTEALSAIQRLAIKEKLDSRYLSLKSVGVQSKLYSNASTHSTEQVASVLTSSYSRAALRLRKGRLGLVKKAFARKRSLQNINMIGTRCRIVDNFMDKYLSELSTARKFNDTMKDITFCLIGLDNGENIASVNLGEIYPLLATEHDLLNCMAQIERTLLISNIFKKLTMECSQSNCSLQVLCGQDRVACLAHRFSLLKLQKEEVVIPLCCEFGLQIELRGKLEGSMTESVRSNWHCWLSLCIFNAVFITRDTTKCTIVASSVDSFAHFRRFLIMRTELDQVYQLFKLQFNKAKIMVRIIRPIRFSLKDFIDQVRFYIPIRDDFVETSLLNGFGWKSVDGKWQSSDSKSDLIKHLVAAFFRAISRPIFHRLADALNAVSIDDFLHGESVITRDHKQITEDQVVIRCAIGMNESSHILVMIRCMDTRIHGSVIDFFTKKVYGSFFEGRVESCRFSTDIDLAVDIHKTKLLSFYL